MKPTTIVIAVVALLCAATTAQAECLRVLGDCLTVSGDGRGFGPGSAYDYGGDHPVAGTINNALGLTAELLSQRMSEGAEERRDIRGIAERDRDRSATIQAGADGQAALAGAAGSATPITVGAPAPHADPPGSIYVRVLNIRAERVEILLDGAPFSDPALIEPGEEKVIGIVPPATLTARYEITKVSGGKITQEWLDETVDDDPGGVGPFPTTLSDGRAAEVYDFVVQP